MIARKSSGIGASTCMTSPVTGCGKEILRAWSIWRGAGEERPRVPFGEEHIHRGPRFMRVLQEEVPSLNSEKTTRGFIEQHGDAICSGVLGRLFAMQKRPWSDPQQAADERMNYENAKSELRMRFEVPPGGRFIDTSQVL